MFSFAALASRAMERVIVVEGVRVMGVRLVGIVDGGSGSAISDPEENDMTVW